MGISFLFDKQDSKITPQNQTEKLFGQHIQAFFGEGAWQLNFSAFC